MCDHKKYVGLCVQSYYPTAQYNDMYIYNKSYKAHVSKKLHS